MHIGAADLELPVGEAHRRAAARSEAPAIRDEREELFAILRRMVIARGDTHLMWQLVDIPDCTRDAEIADKLLRVLPATDPRRAVLLAKMDRDDAWRVQEVVGTRLACARIRNAVITSTTPSAISQAPPRTASRPIEVSGESISAMPASTPTTP